MSRRFWTEDKIVTEIQKLYSQGEDLWYRAMERQHKDLIRASERYFKGWKNAVVAAGLDYDNIKKRSHQVWSEEKILQELYNLMDKGTTLRPSIVQKENKKLYHAAIRQFQNFNNVIEKLNEKFSLNLEIRPGRQRQSSTEKTTKPTRTQRSKGTKKDQKQTGIKPTRELPPELLKNMKIFTVRTRVRSERQVGEAIIKRALNNNVNVGNIQYPAILNGYIFVECDDREKLNRLVKNIRNAQGLLNGETTMDEITSYVGRSRSRKAMVEGTKIEITDGQFKGERAIIHHVNNRTKELVVELVDEVLKMPITITREQCKIVS